MTCPRTDAYLGSLAEWILGMGGWVPAPYSLLAGICTRLQLAGLWFLSRILIVENRSNRHVRMLSKFSLYLRMASSVSMCNNLVN